MSRSIHTTRRKIFEEKRWDYDLEPKHQKIAKLKQDLSRKRTIKGNLDNSYGTTARLANSESTPSIKIRAVSEHEFFPASQTDIENVIRSLPRGTTDGLKEIILSTGFEEQTDHEHYSLKTEDDVDPYIGRISSECWPGTFHGSIFSQYFSHTNTIFIYSYVSGPELQLRPIAELYLRRHMLSTLVHELAHHYDLTAANKRGKWHLTKDSREKYASNLECDWTQNYVMPYLMGEYAEACHTFEEWVEQYGGVKIPIDQFFVDRNSNKNMNTFDINFQSEMLDYAIVELARSVIENESSQTRWLGFATDLRIGQRLNYAEQLTKRLLTMYPDDADILIERARQFVDLTEFDKAEQLLKSLLFTEQRDESILVLCRVYTRQKLWAQLLDTTELSMSESTDLWKFRETRMRRAVALHYSGRTDEFARLRDEVASYSASWLKRLDYLTLNG